MTEDESMEDESGKESFLENFFNQLFKEVPFEEVKSFAEKFADAMLDDMEEHPEHYLMHTDLELYYSSVLPQIFKLPGFERIPERLKTLKQQKNAAVAKRDYEQAARYRDEEQKIWKKIFKQASFLQ